MCAAEGARSHARTHARTHEALARAHTPARPPADPHTRTHANPCSARLAGLWHRARSLLDARPRTQPRRAGRLAVLLLAALGMESCKKPH